MQGGILAWSLNTEETELCLFEAAGGRVSTRRFYHSITLFPLVKPLEREEEKNICRALRAKRVCTEWKADLILSARVEFETRELARAGLELVQQGGANIGILRGGLKHEASFAKPVHWQVRQLYALSYAQCRVVAISLQYFPRKVCLAVERTNRQVDFILDEYEDYDGVKGEKRMLRRFLTCLSQLDPDCIVCSHYDELSQLYEQCRELDMNKLLSRASEKHPCRLSSRALRIPGRVVVDLHSLAQVLQATTKRDNELNTALDCILHFNEMGGVLALEEACQGYAFEDVVEFGFPPLSSSSAKSEIAVRMDHPAARKRVRTSAGNAVHSSLALGILHQTSNAREVLLPQFLSRATPPQVSALALDCAKLGSVCLARLNSHLAELNCLNKIPPSCDLLRPALLKLQVSKLKTSSNSLEFVLSCLCSPANLSLESPQGENFLQSVTRSKFIQWMFSPPAITLDEPEFDQALVRLSDAELKRLLLQVREEYAAGNGIRTAVLRRFCADWLDSSLVRKCVASSFESLLKDNTMGSLAADLFALLSNAPVEDVFEATCPKRLRSRVDQWRAVGERVANASSTRAKFAPVDGGFSLWSKALLGTELGGTNTLCFALGFLFPRPQISVTAAVDLENNTQDAFVAAAFLTVLITAVFDVRFRQDVPVFAYLVQETSGSSDMGVSMAVRALLEPDALRRLDKLLALSPNHHLPLAIALFMFQSNTRRDTAHIREQLYAICANEAEVACSLALEIQRGVQMSDSFEDIPHASREEERLLLSHFYHHQKQQEDCLRCTTPLDLLWKIHLVCCKSPLALVLLAKRLEQMGPITVPRLQVLGKQVCKSLAERSEDAALCNAKIRLLGAISSREGGGKKIIMEHLDWNWFVQRFLSHPIETVKCNSFILLHNICTRIQSGQAPPPQQQQQHDSYFINKQEDAQLFQIECMSHLCANVLQRLVALQPQQQGMIWENGVPTCTALLELYVKSTVANKAQVDAFRLEIARAMLPLLLQFPNNSNNNGLSTHRDFFRMLAMGIRATPLLHLLKQQLTASQKPALAQALLPSLDDAETRERIKSALL